MRIIVPITGEIIAFDPEHPELASGNPSNVVRPLDFNKLLPGTDFAFQAINYDFVNGLVELEVTFIKKRIPTKWRDETNEELLERTVVTGHSVERKQYVAESREETDVEFQQRKANIEKALNDTFNKKTINELYQMTGEPRLKKPVV